MYDVCDVYIEIVKPVFAQAPEGVDGKASSPNPGRLAAQATLYTTIEHFLRLLHPIMPFVTEELWQRLPNRALLQTAESIMIAPYPVPEAAWASPAVEADMEIVKEAIHGARSLRADYKVPNHVKADFFFRTEAPEVRAALLAQTNDFCFLSKAKSLALLGAQQEAPPGCCVVVLSDRLTLLVDLTGIIDVEVELLRLGKEVERLRPQIDTYRKKAQVAGYDKVPESVRVTNAEKLASSEAELAAVEAAMADFAKMKA